MPYTHYQRLSALDATFLEIEDENSHMHVGAVAVFDAAPLTRPEGGLDVERISAVVEASLHRIPRYRQRLAWVPFLNHPVWVDDPRFNLHYHLRHASLPAPGDERQLKRFAGHAMAQPLDRHKPLWELWIVEGLEGGRFALITKTHHCLIDGVGSAEMMASFLGLGPDSSVSEPPRWLPRQAPGPLGLLAGEVRHRIGGAFDALGGLARSATRPLRSLSAAGDVLAGVGEALRPGLRPASPTPLNVEIGPHRRFDWLRFELDDVKEVKRRLGGTVNDVVLAVVAGALRRFLLRRGENVDALDFRAMLPVNIRRSDEGDVGNRITMMAARLPLDEADARRRLERVSKTTRELKESRQAHGLETLEEISDWTFTSVFIAFARMTARARPYNVVVTNVPGPQFQGYLLGAPLLEAYPLVPLVQNQALGIALFSYDGGLFWGFNADWDALPDLHDLVEAIGGEFEVLRKAATSEPGD